MSIYRELDYTAKIRSITRVEFGILSPEEIIKRSVAHVHKTTLYENNGEPTIGGLFDPRMGVIDRGKLCKTCHLDRTFCTGHAGHIELVKPVFQFQYIYIILRFLKSICLFCNKSLVDINHPMVRSIIKNCGHDNQKLFMEMTDLASKRKICGRESDTDLLGNPKGCGMIQPSKYQKLEFKIFAEWKVGKNEKKDKEERKLNLTPERISTLFAKIPREDSAIFGFSEHWCLPHWLITNVLPVSPPSVRPSVRQYNNQRSEDDLTIKYIDIIKYNNILKKKLHSGSSKDTIGYYFLCLQFHVATLIDNESQSKTAVTRASNRPLRTYKQRLHSKEGRIRGNLMGKRVDFSARSVITPDPNISIDQLGVPKKIAMNLTSPEKVNQFNYHKLYKLILNGAHKYPGVKKIKKLSDGKTFTLEFCDNQKTLKEIADNLEEGDTVHRHLMNDDYILFNRQPSLHKMSMMAHRVVVMDHSTFRLNVSATSPYNADFDGDEMNMHVPQSLQASIELREIAAIPKQIISPAKSEPIIVPVQDTLIGFYKITGEGVKFNRREALALLSKVSTFDGELPVPQIPGKDGAMRFWTGHQLVSLILPEINLKMEDDDKVVEIVQGRFIKGQVDKGVSKKIVHIIFNDFGSRSCQIYLDNLQNMMTAYLIREGFSVGVGDLMIDQRVKKVIKKIIDKGSTKVNAIHHDIHQGTFSDLSFANNSDAYEHKIKLIVGEIERDVENLVINTVKNNRILQAVRSGSKGTTFHFRSMTGVVGAQAVDGKRIPFGYSDRTRSLPHFYKYDDSLIPKGFVTHSFIDGLSPEEFFFHAMGGREGLIDTAVKSVTAETPVVLIQDNKPIHTKIGDWIDEHLSSQSSRVKHLKDQNMELLDLDQKVLIPTMDYNGNVSWAKLTAVTRHDPGEVLYKIKTQSGRDVTVTASKSLLVWKKNLSEFRETLTNQIEVGDYLPTTAKLASPPLNLSVIHNGKETYFNTHDGGKEFGSVIESQMPNDIFGASNDFIKGFFSELFCKKNCIIMDDLVYFKSYSVQFLENLAMLLSRLGIFSKIKEGKLVIDQMWATKFVEQIKLSDDVKQSILNKMQPLKNRQNLHVNDIVKDQIIEISKIDVKLHPKMYDVTVPETLNFGLANGLQVRDTSESGYIQRRLVKGLEDLKVHYDYTVRSATGDIYQFIYGEDAIHGAGLLEKQSLKFLYWTYTKIAETYRFSSSEKWQLFMTDDATKRMKKAKGWKDRLESYFKDLMTVRDYLVKDVFQYQYETSIVAPINLARLISNVKAKFELDPERRSNLTPLEVEDELNTLFEDLQTNGHPHHVMVALIKFYLSPKELIKRHRFNRTALNYLTHYLRSKYQRTKVDPGEMVGPLAAQSIGEISTQLTLNSIVGEEQILIQEDGVNKVVEIGSWIDSKLKANSRKIKHIPENRTEYLDLTEKVLMPTCDMDGKTSWAPLTAVTKHLPVGDLVKITTRSGRTVTATQSKSFLIYDEKAGKLTEMEGSKIKVGDKVPIITNLDNVKEETTHLKISDYFPRDEWLYGSDYHKAKVIYEKHVEDKKAKKPTSFVTTYNAKKKFILPYKRYDSFIDVLNGKKMKRTTIEDGYVYPKLCQKVCAKIPEKIKLDQDFGFIVGLYLAEGWVTNTFMGISNNDPVICKKVYDWCDSIGVTHHTVVSENKRFPGSKSTDMKLHSVILARLFKKWVNTGSSEKIVPPEAYTAPDEFVKGLLDGYISGDGTVSKKCGSVIVTSVSENLILGVSNLMARFGIFGRLSNRQATKNNVGSKNIKRTYVLRIANKFAKNFANKVGSTHPSKKRILKDITLPKKNNHPNGRYYETQNNVVLDEITIISLIKNTDDTGKIINVYDVTVPRTLNLTTVSNLCLKDTFHTAGKASTVTTGGVARLKELMANSKKIKSPSILVYLDEEYSKDKAKALNLLHNLELTTIENIISSVSLYLDTNHDTNIAADKTLVDVYRLFGEITEQVKDDNPWILRVKFNRAEMMERNINMNDLYLIIQQNFANVNCIYTDDNSGELVMRLKLEFDGDDNNADNDIRKMKEFEQKIVSTIVKGIPEINHVIMDEIKERVVLAEGNVYQPVEERILITQGSNLEEVLSQDHIDPTRTGSNDCNEMLAMFGIEAARNTIIEEFGHLIKVSPRHLGILADFMTHKGYIMPIDRHGINRGNAGPLAKSSFEETIEQLLQAGVFGKIDNMKGVSANIMMGHVTPSGTGFPQIFLDEKMLVEELKKRPVKPKLEKMSDQDVVDKFMNIPEFCQDGVGIHFDLDNIPDDKVKLDHIPKVEVE